MENIGVMVEAKTMWFSNMKDKNLILASKVFCGVIKKVLKIDYVIFIVPLCKCKWVLNKNGIKTD